jgi:DmsE family decaheme c-type cytochrome
MAWHSSTHNMMGVACTDCHNPHPTPGVQQNPRATGVSFLHTNVRRPARRSMAVEEPEACYKCHPKIYAMNALPSHHPVKEGKMNCSDCHDSHGQQAGSLAADSGVLLCWKCHAEKQGPFAYEHPPVTEDCGICHEPHGTVANNLLKQPPTFLCLRCHTGHRDGSHGGGDRVDIDINPQLQPGFYTDCMTCHSQIHGSDLPTPHFPAMFR